MGGVPMPRLPHEAPCLPAPSALASSAARAHPFPCALELLERSVSVCGHRARLTPQFHTVGPLRIAWSGSLAPLHAIPGWPLLLTSSPRARQHGRRFV